MSKWKSKKIMIKPERKHNEVFYTQTASSGASSAQLLNGITQGVQHYERIGQEIVSKSIQCRGQVLVGGGSSPITYRILIVQDRQTSGVLPTLGNVLHDVTSTQKTLLSPYKLANRKRFKIIWDHTDTLDSGQGTSNFEMFFSNTGFKTEFLGTTSAVTDLSSNGIYFWIISDGLLDAHFYFRHRFYDS